MQIFSQYLGLILINLVKLRDIYPKN